MASNETKFSRVNCYTCRLHLSSRRRQASNTVHYSINGDCLGLLRLLWQTIFRGWKRRIGKVTTFVIIVLDIEILKMRVINSESAAPIKNVLTIQCLRKMQCNTSLADTLMSCAEQGQILHACTMVLYSTSSRLK